MCRGPPLGCRDPDSFGTNNRNGGGGVEALERRSVPEDLRTVDARDGCCVLTRSPMVPLL